MTIDQYNPKNNTVLVKPVRDKFTVSSSTASTKRFTTSEIVYSDIDLYLFKNANLVKNSQFSLEDSSDSSSGLSVIVIDGTVSINEDDVLIADYYNEV